MRLHERDDFFAEHWDGGKYFLGMQIPFSAAHRLHADQLAPEDNVALYGKCNNPLGHGHRYLTEATIGGAFDERSGALMDFVAFRTAITEAVRPWQDKHLDLELSEFKEQPSTGENIVRALWPRFDSRLDGRLVRLRLWETANNRFTLRNCSRARSQAPRVRARRANVPQYRSVLENAPAYSSETSAATFRLQRPFRGLQIRLVIASREAETPLDERGVILVQRLAAIQEGHDLLLERVLLAGLIQDLENLHRQEPIVGMLLLLRFPDFAQTLVTPPCAHGYRAPARTGFPASCASRPRAI